MKRNRLLSFLTVLCLLFALPLCAHAQSYSPSETDMTLSIDDTYWYVFTRDNIADNPEMEELGISYDYLHDFFLDNNAYIDGVLLYENGEYTEILVIKISTPLGVANLSDYSYDEVMELAETLGKRSGSQDYSVYENNYKFARVDYYDETAEMFVCDYTTIVNSDSYTIKFQSGTAFSDDEYKEMKTIIDSIHFQLHASTRGLFKKADSEKADAGKTDFVSTDLPPSQTTKTDQTLSPMLQRIIYRGVIGGVIGFISRYHFRWGE